MKQYIAIAAAMLMMAIPVSAYDQTYVFTQDDFSLIEGEPIPISFTVSLSPGIDDLHYFISSTPQEVAIDYSELYIMLGDEPNSTIKLNSISTSGYPDGHATISPSYIENHFPAISASRVLHTKLLLVLTSNNISSVYTLTHSCPLDPELFPYPTSSFPITGIINPSAPVIENITLEQLYNMDIYYESHVLHYTISDRNGWEDVIHVSFQITNLNTSEIIEEQTYNSIPIHPYAFTNTTHAITSYGMLSLYPQYNYSITMAVTDSSGLSDTKTIFYTPHPFVSIHPPSPDPEPLFSVDPIYFCDTQAGFNAVGNLTIHNHNGPTVKISSTLFEDFHIFNGGNLVGQIAAINLRYSIPATTLSANESVTFPLKLYIPLGTKAGTIHSAGRIELTTV